MAQFIWAIFHLEGMGYSKNEAEAERWLEAFRKNSEKSSKQELLEGLKTKPFVEWDFNELRQ